MVRLIRKEEKDVYPRIAKDLLKISKIPSWVELDLSGFPKTSLIGTGLDPVKNSGVFIHPEDIPLLGNVNVNFQEVLSHSYGTSSGGTLTYRPLNQSTRILVSIPLEIMKSIKNTTTLTDIDKILGFHRMNTEIYTTGSGGIKGYKIPLSYYGMNEGRTSPQITDFTCQYKSLLPLGKQNFIEKTVEDLLTKEQCLTLLLGLLEFTPKIARDKQLKKDLLQSLMLSLDSSLFDGNVTEEIVKLNKDIISDLGTDVFINTPKIIAYIYNMYFSTQQQLNSFLKVLGKTKEVAQNIDKPNVNRNAETEKNIYVFRPSLKDDPDENKKKHILSILTCPTGQFKISRAINDWGDILEFSSSGHLYNIK